eukprot:15166842-Alexandrium_andersonii.AAC.1
MSASLVGSEMCIRDRNKGVHFGGSENTGNTSELRSRPGANDWAPLIGACLLYTSDAADDM